eukprot:7864-Amphidinium_carterae.4
MIRHAVYLSEGKVRNMPPMNKDKLFLEGQILRYLQTHVLQKEDRQAIGPRGMCLGLHTRRGAWVTKATQKHHDLLSWCHSLASMHGLEYTSVQINVATSEDSGMCLHKDRFNLESYPNMVYVLSNSSFTGGRLWSETNVAHASEVPPDLQGMHAPSGIRGLWRGEQGQWMKLDPHRWHGVERVHSGMRISIVTFVPGYLHRVKAETWKELDACSFPCSTIREIGSPEGSVLWKLWQCPASPERRLYSVVTDGETMVYHKEELGVSHVLVAMGHTPHRVLASELFERATEYPTGIGPDSRLWLYEANQTCGFFGAEEDDPEPLNHQQRSFFQWIGQSIGVVEENCTLAKCEHHVEHELFPVLLTPDEELQAIETPEADGEDLGEEQEEDPEWTPSESERTAIQHAHDNSGHPSLRGFVRLLKQGGARPEVVRWVSQNYECEQCKTAQRPLARIPASVPGSSRFNAIVGMDTFQLSNPTTGEQEWWLECVCWGTAYGVVERVANKSAIEVWRAYSTCWRRYFSEP